MSTSNQSCPIKPKQNLANSFKTAGNGIGTGLVCERNFQIHLILAVVAIILLLWLGASLVEWAIIVLAIVTVMSLELVNTALEKLIDFLNPDIHPTIKVVKDMVGGAVLIAAIGAAAVGCLIILPKIITAVAG